MYHPSCTTSLLGRETHTRKAPQELRVSKAETLFRKNGARSRLGSNAAVRNGSYSQVESLCTNTGTPRPSHPRTRRALTFSIMPDDWGGARLSKAPRCFGVPEIASDKPDEACFGT